MTIITPKRFYFEDLQIGMEASVLRHVTMSQIATFAEVSGDKNPVHLDAEYAAKTAFKGCIAHGMLTAAHLSSVFGMELPGPGAIYVSQTLNFRAPVRPGDTVLSKVKVVELFPAKRRVRFDCVCLVDDKPVLEGEAMIMVPSRPQAAVSQ
jgi:3-hydroxybutyryl-CoA dehydratase